MQHKRLFCEWSPLTYRISKVKCKTVRYAKDLFRLRKLAGEKDWNGLPHLIFSHSSPIRRKLGGVDPKLQDNKAANLSIAVPRVNGILIRPGQTFSFWRLVGAPSARKGYKDGLFLSNGTLGSGTGGGLCQFTNLIHWMVLHSPLEVSEIHHHDGVDLFPDSDRQVPFGMGTSIVHNYLDYRFRNPTGITFQLITYTTPDTLCGELRADKPMCITYKIRTENECFVTESDGIYRSGNVYRDSMDKKTGEVLITELLRSNHAKVMYDTQYIPPDLIRKNK